MATKQKERKTRADYEREHAAATARLGRPPERGERGWHPANAGEVLPGGVLTPDEFDRLLAAVPGRSTTAVRNRALLLTMHAGALRVKEAVELKPAAVDIEGARIDVAPIKRAKKSRVVFLDPRAQRALAEWMTLRGTLGWDQRKAYLFGTLYSRPNGKGSSRGGGRLDEAYLRRLLPKLAVRAKIDKRVHSHMLRHTRAAELAREGMPVHEIQRMLGHRSLATTNDYLNHHAPDGLRQWMTGERGRDA